MIPCFCRVALFPLLACLPLIACDTNDCIPGIKDQVDILDTVQYNGVTYYFVIKTVGFQEKTSFFKLYDKKPVFDSCNVANIEPIWEEPIDDFNGDKFVKKVVFQENSKEKKFEIIYTTNEKEAIDIFKAKLSRK